MTEKFKSDHFLHQFDRFPEGEERLAAMASHAAHLLNNSGEERADHIATVKRVIEEICEDNAGARLVLSLTQKLRDLDQA